MCTPAGLGMGAEVQQNGWRWTSWVSTRFPARMRGSQNCWGGSAEEIAMGHELPRRHSAAARRAQAAVHAAAAALLTAAALLKAYQAAMGPAEVRSLASRLLEFGLIEFELVVAAML